MMRPDLQMSVMCDDVRQERNGKFILIGLFDVVGLPGFPVVYPRICIVNRWCCGEGEFTELTRIVSPDNGPVVAEGQQIVVRLTTPEMTVTNVEIFLNTRFEREGVYWLEVLLDGDMTLRYPLRILRAAPAHAAEGPPPA